MDARITKQRLGNMFSYDWIKMLVSIAAAVAVLVLLFTMVGTRPTRAQRFIVHAYGGVETGTDFNELSDRLGDVLSYDILEVEGQSFGTDYLDDASYTARRSSGEGSVMLVADYSAPDKEGNPTETPFHSIVKRGIGTDRETGDESLNLFYRLDEYFADLEAYLARFFGENWRENAQIDRAEAEACFRARNVDGGNNGHRYKTAAQIEAGIEDEVRRLTALRADYLFLDDGWLGSNLPLVDFVSERELADGTTQQRTYTVGVNLGNLLNIEKLVRYYDASGNRAHAKLTFLIYRNYGEGVYDDLNYEPVSFLAYLVREYS